MVYKIINSQQKPMSLRSGVSLVELIIVLAISSLMIGGSLAWFNSRSTTEFYDRARQVESIVRSVQSENQSNYVPGYVTADCSSTDRPTCVIKKGEEVFGTAVAVSPTGAVNTNMKIRAYYLKRTAPTPPNNQSEFVQAYSTDVRDLPAGIRVEGFKVFGVNSSGKCTYNREDYQNTLYQESFNPTSEKGFISNSSWSLVVFRRVSGSYNAFYSATGNIITNSSLPFTGGGFSGRKPVGFTNDFKGAGYRGNYDDPLYVYSPSPTGSDIDAPVSSRPCAIMWRLGSTERAPGSPGIGVAGTKPRFTAELLFNLAEGTTRLQTR